MSQEMLKERLDLFRNTVRGGETHRVPPSSNFWTWKVLDSDLNLTLMQANEDLSLMEKAVREFHERYHFDTYEDLGTRNMFHISNPLGNPGYVIDDEAGTINAPDWCLMEDDEYDEIIENPVMFGWTKIMPRKFKSFSYDQYRGAVQGFLEYNAYSENIQKIFIEEYGCPQEKNGLHMSPVEDLFSWGLRGFRAFSKDMRRQPDKIDAYIGANEPMLLGQVEASLTNKNPNAIYDVYSVMLAHSCMNAKQFERFYYITLKKILDMVEKYDGLYMLFCEASYLQIKDFFKDFPDGHLAVTIEQDDIMELRRECPNITITGGMPVELLGNGTPEQCVDYAKKLIDSLGGSHFVLSQNKMMSFRNDCRRENLLAVQDYALNYRF